MASTLADVVVELQTLNTSSNLAQIRLGSLVTQNSAIQATLADIGNKLSNAISGLTQSVNDSIDYQKIAANTKKQQDAADKLQGAEDKAERETGGLRGYLKEAGQGGFSRGVTEGIIGKGLYGWLSQMVGGLFGRGGLLMAALPRILGRIVGRLGLAGLVLSFGQDVLTSLFKALRDNGLLFNWSDEELNGIAGKATDGLFNAILVSIVTKNPLARLGAFIVGYFKDEILRAIKYLFGIRANSETGNYEANLPFMDSIDLGPSEKIIENSITAAVTAVTGMVALFLSKKVGGLTGLTRKLLGASPAAAGAGAGAAKAAGAAGAGGAAGGTAAGSGRVAATTLTAAQKTAINSLDDATLAAAGLAKNSTGQIIRQGSKQFASNAEMLNALASQKNPRFARLLGVAKNVPLLGKLIAGGLLASILLDDSTSADEKVKEIGGLFGSILGGIGGAAVGGSIAGALGLVTGPGAIITGIAGAVLGGVAGDFMGQELASMLVGGQPRSEGNTLPPDVANDITVKADNAAPPSPKSGGGGKLAGEPYTPGSTLTPGQVTQVSTDIANGQSVPQEQQQDLATTLATRDQGMQPITDKMRETSEYQKILKEINPGTRIRRGSKFRADQRYRNEVLAKQKPAAPPAPPAVAPVSEVSGTVRGLMMNDDIRATPEYQKILNEDPTLLEADPFAAQEVADMQYRAELLKGTIAPPPGVTIERSTPADSTVAPAPAPAPAIVPDIPVTPMGAPSVTPADEYDLTGQHSEPSDTWVYESTAGDEILREMAEQARKANGGLFNPANWRPGQQPGYRPYRAERIKPTTPDLSSGSQGTVNVVNNNYATDASTTVSGGGGGGGGGARGNQQPLPARDEVVYEFF